MCVLKGYLLYLTSRQVRPGTHDKYIQDQPWSSLYASCFDGPTYYSQNYAGRMWLYVLIALAAYSLITAIHIMCCLVNFPSR